jgi:hypothetical protein
VARPVVDRFSPRTIDQPGGSVHSSATSLAPDGKRFAVFPLADPSSAAASAQATFVVNFFDELRRRVPVQ